MLTNKMHWNNLMFFLFVAYGTSKVGLIALTKVSARQMSPGDKEDILVNSVSNQSNTHIGRHRVAKRHESDFKASKFSDNIW